MAADLELAPRQRVKVEIEEADDADGSDSEDETENSGRKKRKKAFGDFMGSEVKRFVRSFRKFAYPLQRLEALAQDAELEEHSTEELKKLAEALLDGCEKAEQEHDMKKNELKPDSEKAVKDRGPWFKFAGVVDVNVRAIRKLHRELQPLHAALSGDASSSFKPPHKARPQKGWDVEWTSVDDAAVLQGVYKYGVGSWEAIKMDPELGLADKIFLKDKIRKPQPRHVQQRVDYLLKLMEKSTNGTKVVPTKVVSRKRKAPDDDKVVEEKKRREKEHHHHHHHSKHSKQENAIADQLALVAIEKSIYGSALEDPSERPFSECVKMMRPVQKYIKKLAEASSEKDASKYLMRLGDNCRDQLDDLLKRKPKTNVRKWYNYMWIFLSKFVSQEPMELLQKYRELCIANHRHKHRDHHQHQHNHHHAPKDHSPQKHDGEKRKDKDRDKKDDKEHKKKHHHHKTEKSLKDHKTHHGNKDRRYPRDDNPTEYRSPLVDEYRGSPMVRPSLLSSAPR